MPKDSHQGNAEFHDLAAHAHRVAATHDGNEDHMTGHEYSWQAVEHAVKAYLFAQEIYRESEGSAGKKE